MIVTNFQNIAIMAFEYANLINITFFIEPLLKRV